uniref:Presenilin n=1 Tax=Schistosoma japonicum TaxID=6182 RepID=C1LIV0_SCHJA|nr:Presenilin [Schistosoma japonicum]
MSTRQSSSQPVGRLNKTHGQPSHSDVFSSNSASHNHLPVHNFSSHESIISINPDQMLYYGAKQIISLFIPVTVCMLFVVTVASTVDFYGHTDQYLLYTPFHTPDADIGTQTWQTIANTLIFMSVVVVMTCILVLLFKYQCYKFIRGWIIMTTVFLLFLISFMFFAEVLRAMGVFVDYITVAFTLWNFGVVGMIVIHWRGPLILQQAYLIFISAQIALMFLKYLPKWTCWLVLAALSIWDIVAVLCPNGPLRMLVEMAHERQQPLFPALLYSTTAVYLVKKYRPVDKVENSQPSVVSVNTHTADILDETLNNNMQSCPTTSGYSVPDNSQPVSMNLLNVHSNETCETSVRETVETLDANMNHNNDSKNDNESSTQVPHETDPFISRRVNRWRELQADLIDRDSKGVKLGLGDFVFYSLLIGRATLDGDAVTVVTCYVAILVGMCITIIVLGITRRALPALPISIACGILFYFVSSATISPFLEATAIERVFF